MHPQAAAEATKTPPGAPKGSEERFWGDFEEPKGRPKRGKFGALSLAKLRRDFGAIWGSILERLGVPKRGVLRHNKRAKKQDKDRMRVGENSRKN